MPRGLNRTNLNSTGTSYRNGTPVTLPITFGNPVTLPHDFGNDAPFTFGNPVTLPHDFGNDIGSGSSSSYLLQADGVSHILLAQGGAILV